MKNNPKKGQIIKTAQKRFSKHGLSKTTMEEIARDLRMGKATLYHYFKSKEEIFYEAIKLEIERYKTELNSLLGEKELDYNQKQNIYQVFKETVDEKYPILFELITQTINGVAYEKEIFYVNKLVSEESKLLQLVFDNNNKDFLNKVTMSVQLSWLFPYLNKIKQATRDPKTSEEANFNFNLFA